MTYTRVYVNMREGPAIWRAYDTYEEAEQALDTLDREIQAREPTVRLGTYRINPDAISSMSLWQPQPKETNPASEAPF